MTDALEQPDRARAQPLFEQGPLPLLIQAEAGVSPVAWASEHRAYLGAQLDRFGAILFRGFDVTEADGHDAFVSAAFGTSLPYAERSSPRSQVKGNVYTSTDYPKKRPIFPHNEQSYNLTFPRVIAFFCERPADEGGETPIVDCRKMLARIDEGVKERFHRLGYAYVRNYGFGAGLSWSEVFQTEDRDEVEAYCAANQIEAEWLHVEKGILRTRQVRPVIARHPRSGAVSWFNHLTFFHVTTLQEKVRNALVRLYGEENLPNNTYYGDGAAIEADVLDHLRGLYLEEKVAFSWERGDVLVVDNMLVAHARNPFSGDRRVLVTMSEPVQWDDCRVP